ncbi:hypothetical protein BHM03_00042017, partial [Ensete ventricosum]
MERLPHKTSITAASEGRPIAYTKWRHCLIDQKIVTRGKYPGLKYPRSSMLLSLEDKTDLKRAGLRLNIRLGHRLLFFRYSVNLFLQPRFAISIFTARYRRYIPVRQVAGTRTARYRAVPPKIDRRRSIEGEIERRRSIEREKGRKKKKRKKKKKKEKRRKKPCRPRAVLTHAPSPHASCQRPHAIAARESRALFLPHREKDRGD